MKLAHYLRTQEDREEWFLLSVLISFGAFILTWGILYGLSMGWLWVALVFLAFIIALAASVIEATKAVSNWIATGRTRG